MNPGSERAKLLANYSQLGVNDFAVVVVQELYS